MSASKEFYPAAPFEPARNSSNNISVGGQRQVMPVLLEGA